MTRRDQSSYAGTLLLYIVIVNSSLLSVAPFLPTTREETALAVLMASYGVRPFARQAMTVPIWESPAPMVSTTFTALTGGT